MFGKTNSSTILNGSSTKGVSITHENLSSSNPIIHNNISINNDVNKDDNGSVNITEIHYSQQEAQSKAEELIQHASVNPNLHDSVGASRVDIQYENNFLRPILRLYIGQTLYFNGEYIVCYLSELIELIQLLTNADVEIEVEPLEVACCGAKSSPYSKINNIWINNDGQRSIFKYTYSQYLSLFDDLTSSLV